MRNRFDNALAIQGGACNVKAILRALTEAVDQADYERLRGDLAVEYAVQDAACQLMLHQLCHLARIGTDDLNGVNGFNYEKATEICERGATKPQAALTE